MTERGQKMAKTKIVRQNAYMRLSEAIGGSRQVKTPQGAPKEGSLVIYWFSFTY